MPQATHPVLTAADVAHMDAHELAYFTDAPVAHAVAFRDFERHITIERAMQQSARAMSTRRCVFDRNAAQVFA